MPRRRSARRLETSSSLHAGNASTARRLRTGSYALSFDGGEERWTSARAHCSGSGGGSTHHSTRRLGRPPRCPVAREGRRDHAADQDERGDAAGRAAGRLTAPASGARAGGVRKQPRWRSRERAARRREAFRSPGAAQPCVRARRRGVRVVAAPGERQRAARGARSCWSSGAELIFVLLPLRRLTLYDHSEAAQMLGVDRTRHADERERVPSSESGRARSDVLRSLFLATPGDLARECEKLRRPGLTHRGSHPTAVRTRRQRARAVQPSPSFHRI